MSFPPRSWRPSCWWLWSCWSLLVSLMSCPNWKNWPHFLDFWRNRCAIRRHILYQDRFHHCGWRAHHAWAFPANVSSYYWYLPTTMDTFTNVNAFSWDQWRIFFGLYISLRFILLTRPKQCLVVVAACVLVVWAIAAASWSLLGRHPDSVLSYCTRIIVIVYCQAREFRNSQSITSYCWWVGRYGAPKNRTLPSLLHWPNLN